MVKSDSVTFTYWGASKYGRIWVHRTLMQGGCSILTDESRNNLFDHRKNPTRIVFWWPEAIFFGTTRVMHSHLFHITISSQYFISITPETKSFLTFSGGLHPANIYLSKINNRNTRKRREIYSRLSLTSFWCF